VSTEPTTVARSTTPAGAEVATLTFDHGPLNLFDQAMFDSLTARVEELAANPPRALLLRAEGKMNSAGVDVHVFKGLTAQRGAELWRGLFANIIDPLEALPCPVVFAAHGLTLTAAFEIALACDIILAAPRAKFGLVETVVGRRRCCRSCAHRPPRRRADQGPRGDQGDHRGMAFRWSPPRRQRYPRSVGSTLRDR
jgi:enoyl-CoA hydratase/carnithine racemase